MVGLDGLGRLPALITQNTDSVAAPAIPFPITVIVSCRAVWS
jgi:hypothetical protein